MKLDYQSENTPPEESPLRWQQSRENVLWQDGGFSEPKKRNIHYFKKKLRRGKSKLGKKERKN